MGTLIEMRPADVRIPCEETITLTLTVQDFLRTLDLQYVLAFQWSMEDRGKSAMEAIELLWAALKIPGTSIPPSVMVGMDELAVGIDELLDSWTTRANTGGGSRKIENSVGELLISVRAYNALTRAGIHTLDDLVNAARDGVLPLVHGIGPKTLAEIKVACAELARLSGRIDLKAVA